MRIEEFERRIRIIYLIRGLVGGAFMSVFLFGIPAVLESPITIVILAILFSAAPRFSDCCRAIQEGLQRPKFVVGIITIRRL